MAGWRLVAIDGSCLDIADTAENAAFFGRPGVSKGEKSAFPQVRLVALAECGTHAMFDAAVGGYPSSEMALADELIGRLQPGMLVLADRVFYSFTLWRKAIATGADLLWRAKTGLRPQHLQTLDDDTWRAQIRPSGEKTVGACFSVNARPSWGAGSRAAGACPRLPAQPPPESGPGSGPADR